MNNSIKSQQQVLATLGYYAGAVDGSWGPYTIQAKLDFERSGVFAPCIPNGGMPFNPELSSPFGTYWKGDILLIEGDEDKAENDLGSDNNTEEPDTPDSEQEDEEKDTPDSEQEDEEKEEEQDCSEERDTTNSDQEEEQDGSEECLEGLDSMNHTDDEQEKVQETPEQQPSKPVIQQNPNMGKKNNRR